MTAFYRPGRTLLAPSGDPSPSSTPAPPGGGGMSAPPGGGPSPGVALAALALLGIGVYWATRGPSEPDPYERRDDWSIALYDASGHKVETLRDEGTTLQDAIWLAKGAARPESVTAREKGIEPVSWVIRDGRGHKIMEGAGAT